MVRWVALEHTIKRKCSDIWKHKIRLWKLLWKANPDRRHPGGVDGVNPGGGIFNADTVRRRDA